jgi:hypothetical protein
MTRKGRAIFMRFTDLVDPKYEADFNTWYATEHLPELLALPGFLDGARYVAVHGGPKYLAVLELESLEAIETAEYKSRTRTPWGDRAAASVIGINRARITGEQVFPKQVENPERGMAPALQIGRMSVPAAVEGDWHAWYNGEYIPGYRTVPGVICARRYRIAEGEVDYTTVYEFEHERVPESPEWAYQREHSSPKSGRMRDVMVMAAGSPGVYRRM